MFAILFGVPTEHIRLATIAITVALALVFGWPLWTYRSVAKYLSTALKLFAVATFVSAAVSLWILPDRARTLASYLRESLTPHTDVFTRLVAADEVDLILCITFIGMGSWASVLYTGLASFERYGRQRTGSLWIESRSSPTMPSPGRLSLIGETEGLRKWYRHSWLDTTFGVVLNLCSTAVLAFLSARLLFGTSNTIGRNYDLLSQQAAFFEPLFGALAGPLFILIGSAFLLDTWLGFIPLMAKGFQEGLHTSVHRLERVSEASLYRIVLVILAAQSIITTFAAAPGSLIRLTAICLAITHPVVIGLLYYTNYRFLPRLYGDSVRPSKLELASLMLSFGAFTVLAGWYTLVAVR